MVAADSELSFPTLVVPSLDSFRLDDDDVEALIPLSVNAASGFLSLSPPS